MVILEFRYAFINASYAWHWEILILWISTGISFSEITVIRFPTFFKDLRPVILSDYPECSNLMIEPSITKDS
jgi:hypothetical protein